MIFVLVSFILIALIDFIPLSRYRAKWGTFAFLTLFVVGLTISILEAIGIDVPSIMMLLWDGLKTLGIIYK